MTQKQKNSSNSTGHYLNEHYPLIRFQKSAKLIIQYLVAF
jgi:hypothetical protein